MRQASRRSWRIGQRQAVEVTHLVYEGTLQAEALALVSAKMRSSLMIEGELPEDGLAALEANDQDVMLALARRLTDRTESIEQSLEALFARRSRAEAESSDYLIGEDQFAAVEEPEIPVHSLGDGAPPGWEQVDVRPNLIGVAEVAATTRGITFKELAQLQPRPRRRRKAVSGEQLKLFGDEVR